METTGHEMEKKGVWNRKRCESFTTIEISRSFLIDRPI